MKNLKSRLSNFSSRLLLGKVKKHPAKKRLALGLFIGMGVILGLVLSVVVFNQQERKKDIQLDVTFVAPHQAIVFWKTEHPTLGFVQSGTNPRILTTRTDQTSSVAGEVHAVVLNEVPLEGMFITIHNDSDSIFLWKEPIFISFDPSALE